MAQSRYDATTLYDSKGGKPKPQREDTGARVEKQKVNNVMGSTAGAGSGDFHMYRHSRRTEMLRVEGMERSAEQEALDDAFDERVSSKRKECEDRTAKNAEKRRKKKEASKKAAAVDKTLLPDAVPISNDGSFLEQAKRLVEAQQAKAAKAKAAEPAQAPAAPGAASPADDGENFKLF
ncbi:hypothetical protein M885DRAFT_505949 [Pelagophyceae sp. CCMP2097]|nr:hypothetical protein M885DRAFT_505949 [Pelagophyceae sp. CCMP2097]|mmetsp:Transcript_4103/g.12700  ORF Transcript_4103/g.12700 Transcript_4103/m.12700 type:complete len:178 (-) Transcript_4103:29-562(-)